MAHSGYNFTKTLHSDIYLATDPTKSDLSQPSKVVLITGSGRGIGRSIALRYAEADVACIILCARTASELDAVEKDINKINSSVQVRKFTVDITKEESVVSVAKSVREEQGRLDILVNNAGTSEQWVPIAEGKSSDCLKTFNINLIAPYLMLHSFLPLLVETAEKEGVKVDVVNMSSIGANVTFPGASAYQVSKAAVSRLTEFADVEYGSKGVNCIAIHPVVVFTELSKGNDLIQKSKLTIPPRERVKLTMLGLVDTPDLAGGMVVWLTKKQLSWLGGRYVSATWDVEELEAMKDEIVEGDKLKQRLVL
jgi:NAD(P)-dependent dehydrogenase (short-subunit alcohol dehydrogenase family)